jgi:asparagine synthase (glutamine-hydrolysing)
MFAFALWDGSSRTLFCARDRLGIKPFYYYLTSKLFVFGSEIKALLAHPDVPASLAEESIGEYLALGYNAEDRTLFQGIRRLPPGHWLKLKVDGGPLQPQIVSYWDVPLPGQAPARSDEDWIAELRHRLEETVRMRLMSDVPLGVFLSGGLDSSTITAITRQLVDSPTQTFSVGYSEHQYSELNEAAETARILGTVHHEVCVSSVDFFSVLPKLIWHEDEPICWPSSVSLFYLSKLAAERVKVVLTGEGADELFAGYERYRYHAMFSRWLPAWRMLPRGLRAAVNGWVQTSPLLSAASRRKLGHTFLGRPDTLESLYLENFLCAFSRNQQTALRGADPGADIYEGYLRHWRAREGQPTLDRLLYADQKTYLAELLMKQDQMSMACSIESRVPLLDHKLVEFAASVPAHLKLRGKGKYIMKQAASAWLPDAVIYRKKKGFPTPLRSWLRDPAAAPIYDRLLAPNTLLAEYTQPTALRELCDRHRAGFEDATDRIWRLLNLQVWGATVLNRKRETEPLLAARR